MRGWPTMDSDVHEALDLYIEYMECDGDDIDNDDARWAFIDAAIEVLEKLTGRQVGDEIAARGD